MASCPLSGSYSEIIRNNFIEFFAVSTSFAATQALFAQIFHKSKWVPIHIGALIPFSHYTLSIIEHRNYPEATVHNAKHRNLCRLTTTIVTFLAIRSNRNTYRAIPYKWGIISLITAYFFANLGNLD